MFWKVFCEDVGEASEAGRTDGRFVLHRHRDEAGPHLDLRLEDDGYLMGWRIAGETLAGEPWATEKAPHPVRWLDQDGDAVRVDAGTYAWIEREGDRRAVLLNGRAGVRRVCAERELALGADAARAIYEALRACRADVRDAGRLILDGVTARRRAIERLCGLGRELDGEAFAESAWRRVLGPLSLEEIHAQLRAYEVRFDEKYPPGPVSRPERLPEMDAGNRTEAALAIAIE